MIWFNGNIVETIRLPVSDRGYLLGDGLFETMLADNGRIMFLEHHLDRLFVSLPELAMPARFERETIAQAIIKLASAMPHHERKVLRLTVTRDGGRGLDMSEDPQNQNWLITATPVPPPPPALSVSIVDICRSSVSLTSRIKSVNYLENILARRQATQKGMNEALLFNEFGRLACAGSANIFIITGDQIITPPVSEGALCGTRREVLLTRHKDIKQATSLSLTVAPISLTDLKNCLSVFLTNSIIGAVPVIAIDDCPKEKSPAMQVISACLKPDDYPLGSIT